ncbi:MAG TPA: gamma-glutamyltransferase, partial [Opitutales bacterium]|nr:gamma-glutamyltransferase [Opitutales bacterium]
NGFPVPVNLSESLITHEDRIKTNAPPEAVEIFYPNGDPLQPGDWLVQEEKAEALERIARDGKDGFYKGKTAEQLVADLNANGNRATLDDLASYETRWLRPLAGGFRNFTVLSAPPPLGGTQVVQPLVLLDSFPLREIGLPSESPLAANRILDAIRIGRRDYNRWVFDPETPVPANGLTSSKYALTRIDGIGTGEVSEREQPGDPWEFDGEIDPRFAHLNPWAPSAQNLEENEDGEENNDSDEPSEEHTTHLSVIDADRNAVAITMTLGPSFGAGFYSSGVFYNNGLTRFGNSSAGNRWEAYRTPRSNTSPTIVLEEDRVRLVTGAQGGSRIPPAIVFNILYALEYDLSASEAMAGARAFPYMFSPVIRLEAGFDHSVAQGLRERGYTLEPYKQQDNYFAGAHMIVVEPDGRLHGAADMRRAGKAVGY